MIDAGVFKTEPAELGKAIRLTKHAHYLVIAIGPVSLIIGYGRRP